MEIRPVTDTDVGDWLTLRQLLFPDTDDVRHEEEAAVIVGNKFRHAVFLCRGDQQEPLGFAEVSLRHQVDGCHSSPVGYLEGLFVVSGRRREGLAGQLVETAEEWARARGCKEFASDTEISNEIGQQTHESLGFEVTERLVLFKKVLAPAGEGMAEETNTTHSELDGPMPEALPTIQYTGGGISGWTVFHIIVGLAGTGFIFLSDISSPAPMAGAIYPMLAVVCVVYVGVVLSVRRYRSRTDERHRGEELFAAGKEEE